MSVFGEFRLVGFFHQFKLGRRHGGRSHQVNHAGNEQMKAWGIGTLPRLRPAAPRKKVARHNGDPFPPPAGKNFISSSCPILRFDRNQRRC
jgi:hypothetical protein